MSAARDRLAAGYYNSNPVSVTNPGGMDDDGHVTNFPAALVDVGTVSGEVVASAEAADTSKGQAQAAASAAANSLAALNLGAGAITDAAAASATAAAGSAAGAQRTVANNFPDRLDATGSWFSEAAVGDPGVIASPATAPAVVAGYGYVYAKANAQGQLYAKGVLSASQGKVYEVEAEIHQVVKGGAETPAAAIGLQGLDDVFASTGAQVKSPLVATPVGVTVIKYRFAYAAPAGGAAWPQPGTSIWLRPFVVFNRKSDDSGAVTASTARVRRLTVRDVTAVVAAEAAQAAAAASAATLTYATTAEAQAGTEPAKIMSPARVKEAIDALAPFGVGSYALFMAPTGLPWRKADGSIASKASFPAMAALIGTPINLKTIPVTDKPMGAANNDQGVAVGFCSGTWVAAAYPNGRIYTSSDLTTWTLRATLGWPPSFIVGEGANIVLMSVDGKVATSSDAGATFTDRGQRIASGYTIQDVALGNGKLIAYAYYWDSGFGGYSVDRFVSADLGLTWPGPTRRANGVSTIVGYRALFVDGKFYLCEPDDVNCYVVTSVNAVAFSGFSLVSKPTTSDAKTIAFGRVGNNLIVYGTYVLGGSTTSFSSVSTDDGATWTVKGGAPSASVGSLVEVAGNALFFAQGGGAWAVDPATGVATTALSVAATSFYLRPAVDRANGVIAAPGSVISNTAVTKVIKPFTYDPTTQFPLPIYDQVLSTNTTQVNKPLTPYVKVL